MLAILLILIQAGIAPSPNDTMKTLLYDQNPSNIEFYQTTEVKNAAIYSGNVTFYDPYAVGDGAGIGSCGIKYDPQSSDAAYFIAALSSKSFMSPPISNPNNFALCFLPYCVLISYKSDYESIVVKVTDTNETAEGIYDIDLSKDAFMQLAQLSADQAENLGRMQVRWRFVDCNIGLGPKPFGVNFSVAASVQSTFIPPFPSLGEGGLEPAETPPLHSNFVPTQRMISPIASLDANSHFNICKFPESRYPRHFVLLSSKYFLQPGQMNIPEACGRCVKITAGNRSLVVSIVSGHLLGKESLYVSQATFDYLGDVNQTGAIMGSWSRHNCAVVDSLYDQTAENLSFYGMRADDSGVNVYSGSLYYSDEPSTGSGVCGSNRTNHMRIVDDSKQEYVYAALSGSFLTSQSSSFPLCFNPYCILISHGSAFPGIVVKVTDVDNSQNRGPYDVAVSKAVFQKIPTLKDSIPVRWQFTSCDLGLGTHPFNVDMTVPIATSTPAAPPKSALSPTDTDTDAKFWVSKAQIIAKFIPQKDFAFLINVDPAKTSCAIENPRLKSLVILPHQAQSACGKCVTITNDSNTISIRALAVDSHSLDPRNLFLNQESFAKLAAGIPPFYLIVSWEWSDCP